MRTLQVELGDRSYPIYIGAGLLGERDLLRQHIRASQVLVVTNETVEPLYFEKLKGLLDGLRCTLVVLPDGEKYKNLETLNTVFDQLLRDGHSRTTTLIALGGGVVGDMTGFAAACYQRGVSFVQIPTTLLAQVDSSVGGKTGVNHSLGKNMIGAFHQPSCVLIDVETLKTLPDREFRSGLAEVIKYGLIGDVDFFEWLDGHLSECLSRQEDVLCESIARSCSNKAAIVAADETETGVRALLNLGHTFGHAIEAWQAYSGWLHGEAVAAGTVIAAELSCHMGLLERSAADRIRNIFLRCGLPVNVPEGMSADDFLSFMQRDKKVLDSRLRLVLLQRIGSAVISEQATRSQIERAIESCCQIFAAGPEQT